MSEYTVALYPLKNNLKCHCLLHMCESALVYIHYMNAITPKILEEVVVCVCVCMCVLGDSFHFYSGCTWETLVSSSVSFCLSF